MPDEHPIKEWKMGMFKTLESTIAATINGHDYLHQFCITEGLNGKEEFATVESINEEPTASTVGFLNQEIESSDRIESPRSEQPKPGDFATSILADAPNFYKNRGAFVSDEGFIKIPRSLLNDPQWKGCRDKYKKVFLTLLHHAAYTEKSFSIDGNIITIGPGQFCTSIRNLVELCNDGVSFKADKVDKNIVERAVSLFFKIGIARHEVRHGRTVITITQRELYEHFQNQSETRSETKVRQHRDINEERKEGKVIEETFDRADAHDRSSLFHEEKKEEKNQPSVFDPPPSPKYKKNNLSEDQKKQVSIVWQFLSENNMVDGRTLRNKDGSWPKGVKQSDVNRWVRDYDFDDIKATILQVKKEGADKSYPGYIQYLFNQNFAQKKKNDSKNRKNVEEIIKTMNLRHLRLTKQYVEDQTNGEQYNFNLPEETFNALIVKSIERANNQNENRNYEEAY